MPDIIISDTSCLIIFNKIGELELLKKVYQSIIITPEVAEEFNEKLPSFIKIQSVKDKKYQEFLETQIDFGEASAIALAKEFDSPLLLLDDLKARKIATKLKLKYTGTLGVINRAKQFGIIEEILPIIIKLKKTNFRISENVLLDLLRKNNEQ
jgi:predicted nucleic acid-binding protein